MQWNCIQFQYNTKPIIDLRVKISYFIKFNFFMKVSFIVSLLFGSSLVELSESSQLFRTKEKKCNCNLILKYYLFFVICAFGQSIFMCLLNLKFENQMNFFNILLKIIFLKNKFVRFWCCYSKLNCFLLNLEFIEWFIYSYAKSINN